MSKMEHCSLTQAEGAPQPGPSVLGHEPTHTNHGEGARTCTPEGSTRQCGPSVVPPLAAENSYRCPFARSRPSACGVLKLTFLTVKWKSVQNPTSNHFLWQAGSFHKNLRQPNMSLKIPKTSLGPPPPAPTLPKQRAPFSFDYSPTSPQLTSPRPRWPTGDVLSGPRQATVKKRGRTPSPATLGALFR